MTKLNSVESKVAGKKDVFWYAAVAAIVAAVLALLAFLGFGAAGNGPHSSTVLSDNNVYIMFGSNSVSLAESQEDDNSSEEAQEGDGFVVRGNARVAEGDRFRLVVYADWGDEAEVQVERINTGRR